MRITSNLGRRLTALFAAGAIAATLGLVVSAPAQATAKVGNLSITPTTGIDTTGLNASLSAPCPDGATGIVGYLEGPGLDPANGALQSFRSLTQSFQIDSTFKLIFQANGIASPSGTFTVRLACLGSDSFTEVGQYSQDVVFTPHSGAPSSFAVVPTPKTATTTALATPTPADPVVQGATVALQATVSTASGTPTGTVQFKSGSTNVGTAQPLVAGVADLSTTAIPAGAGALTAVYSGDGEFATSTSAGQAYIVAGATTLNGTSRVGYTRGCTAVTGGTRTYSWLKNGVATGITTATVKVPVSWLNATISCALTSTKDATSVTRTSAGVKVTAGAASVATVKPKVIGTMRVGKILTCAKGTWSPAATTYRYQWLRAGKAITGKTSYRYKVVKLDRHKLITCRVYAVRTGYLTGAATAVARKVL